MPLERLRFLSQLLMHELAEEMQISLFQCHFYALAEILYVVQIFQHFRIGIFAFFVLVFEKV